MRELQTRFQNVSSHTDGFSQAVREWHRDFLSVLEELQGRQLETPPDLAGRITELQQILGRIINHPDLRNHPFITPLADWLRQHSASVPAPERSRFEEIREMQRRRQHNPLQLPPRVEALVGRLQSGFTQARDVAITSFQAVEARSEARFAETLERVEAVRAREEEQARALRRGMAEQTERVERIEATTERLEQDLSRIQEASEAILEEIKQVNTACQALSKRDSSSGDALGSIVLLAACCLTTVFITKVLLSETLKMAVVPLAHDQGAIFTASMGF